MTNLHFERVHERRPGIDVAGFVRVALAQEVLMVALALMLGGEFAEWTISAGGFVAAQIAVLAAILLLGILAPLCGKFCTLLRALAAPVYAAVLLVFIFKSPAWLSGGMSQLSEDYANAWASYNNNTEYVAISQATDLRPSAIAFLIAAAIIFCLIIYFLTEMRWLLLLPCAAAIVLGLMVCQLPGWAGFGCFAAGVVILWSGEFSASRVVFAERQSRSHAAASVRNLILTAAFAAIVVLICGVAFLAPATMLKNKYTDVIAFQRKMETAVKNIGSSFTRPTSAQVDNSTPEYTGETMLTLELEGTLPQVNVYLANFYSGDYENGEWTDGTGEFSQAARDAGIDADTLALMLRQQAYDGIMGNSASSYYGDAMGLSGSASGQVANNRSKYQCTIAYKNRTTCALLPYFADISGTDGAVSAAREGFLRKSLLKNNITFTGWAQNVTLAYSRENLDSMALASDAEDELREMFSWYNNYAAEMYTGTSSLQAVKNFTRRIHLDFDPADTSQLGAERVNWMRLSAAVEVSAQLAERASYNLYLSDIPSGEDPIEYFLATGKEGYCEHFASAGVLILQNLGIPARYASGYIVKKDAFSENSDGNYEAEVTDRNTHAWAEIYLDDIGWVPFEMTPGYSSFDASLPTDEENQQYLIEQHEEKVKEQQEENSETETDSENIDTENEKNIDDNTEENTDTEAGNGDGSGANGGGFFAGRGTQNGSGGSSLGSGNGGGNGSGSAAGSDLRPSRNYRKILITIRNIALIILVVFAAFFAAVWLRRRHWEKLYSLFKNGKYHRAVEWIHREILFRTRRVTRGKTDRELEQILISAFPSVPADDWGKYMGIVKRSAFSDSETTRDDAEFCYNVLGRLRG
ncbi:MAG: transglutaminase-like domain-containing protein [Clostridiales bacterium]|nr:transglutaminase-like domain-containing protein [Clostridiales bacterium]